MKNKYYISFFLFLIGSIAFSNEIYNITAPIDKIQIFLDEFCDSKFPGFKTNHTGILDLSEEIYSKFGSAYLYDILELYYIANRKNWYPGYSFSNPYLVVIMHEDENLAIKLHKLDEKLILMPTYLSQFNDNPNSMFEQCVKNNKLNIMKYLYNLVGKKFIQWSYYGYDICIDGVMFKENVIGFTNDINIRKYLILIGIPYEIEYNSFDTECLADKVRIRESPFLDGKIIGYLMKNDTVTIIGYSSFADVIDGGQGYHWIKVKKDDVIGWCYAKYFDIRYAMPK